MRFFGTKLLLLPKKIVYIASRESVHEIRDFILIIKREDDSTHQKKVPGKKTRPGKSQKLKNLCNARKRHENDFKLF